MLPKIPLQVLCLLLGIRFAVTIMAMVYRIWDSYHSEAWHASKCL
jgi:hypothetical protein